ncbi:histidine phosphotransferase family protein [Halodurantibacterium flavum]|uniref:Histidine phosphotransferase family protein n=1 Tax=Halodurantibacterium flavum TaxID=1382802 RepID=A0ABW4S8K3_9RHOB
MTAATDISALLASRICHDLISPLGAIGNGLELMMMAGQARGPEADLIAESVLSANARIRFFRVAYGVAGPQRMGRQEITGILRDMTSGGRLRVDWRPTGEVPRDQVRLAFLVVQCIETAMPFGGTVTITQDGEGWEIVGASPRLRVDYALWDSLERPEVAPEPAASLVHFALLPAEVQAQGRRLRVEVTGSTIRLRY